MTQLPLTGAGPSGGNYIAKVLGYNPIAYWPLNETAGATANCLVNAAQDGAYTGATLGQTVTDASGVTFVCPYFDGANDSVDVLTATLAGVFNGSQGTAMLWIRVDSAAVWADGNHRQTLYFRDNAYNNFANVRKTNAANTLLHQYSAGGVGESYSDSAAGPDADWIFLTIVWDKAGDTVTYYRNGAALATDNTLGVWAGPIQQARIGDDAGSQYWHGWLAQCAVWDSALSAPQIADLAVA